ncbi:RRXRR domain-containing protein [Nodularia spumigena]
MELQHRGLAIKESLETRKGVRRGRRSRHTRLTTENYNFMRLNAKTE